MAIHGNEWIETPNMDRIANEGARCERFFVEPVCAPTRAALLSGRWPTRTGVTGVTRNLEVLSAEVPTALWRDLKAEGLVRADSPLPESDPA